MLRSSTSSRLVALLVVGLSLMGCPDGGSNGVSMTVQVPTPTPSDGTTPALITISVSRDGQLVGFSDDPHVKLSTTTGQFGPSDVGGAQVATESFTNGVATAQLFSTQAGVATVSAAYTDRLGDKVSATVKVTFAAVSVAPPAAIRWVTSTPESISLAGSSSNTTSTVVFALTTDGGAPVADGTMVTFSLASAAGGASLAPLMAATAGGSGQVQTVVSSGTLPGSLVVTATAMGAEGPITGMSSPITMSGYGVSGAHFSLECPHRGIGGFQAFGLSNTCTVSAADVNGAFVANTNVALMTEAGSVPTNVAIIDRNSDSAEFNYVASCPYPVDVAPLTGEFFEEDAGFDDQCPPNGMVHRTANPRDGRATLVAYVLGEQCYRDLSISGHYDPGDYEPACDLGDPYVDENDNGKWDPSCAADPANCDPAIPDGEPYVDVPGGDGGYHGPDGQWHSHTYIWTSTTMVWTGAATRLNAAASPTGTFSALPPAGADDGTVACTNSMTVIPQYVTFADVNGNIPAAVGPNDSVGITAAGATVASPSPLALQRAAESLNDLITLGTPVTLSSGALPLTNGGEPWPGALPLLGTSFANPEDENCNPSGVAEAFTVQLTSYRVLSDGVTGSAINTEIITFPVATGTMAP